MKSILIINEGYSNNLGDQAINNSMELYFQDEGYETSFMYLSKPNIKDLPKYNYEIPPLAKQTSIIKSFLALFIWPIVNFNAITSILKKRQFEKIVIGGGQLIHSSGKKNPHSFANAIFWLSFFIKRYTKAKIYLVAVGAADSFSFAEKIMYRLSFKRIDKIFVRDRFSQDKLNEIFNQQAFLMPDIAFYNSSITPTKDKENLALIGITSFKEVFLRYNNKEGYDQMHYFRDWYKKIEEYRSEGLNVKLFYTTALDAKECLDFKKFILKEYNENIDICIVNSLEELYSLFRRAKKVYSGRMHALILGKKNGCSCEAYIISKKLESFNTEYLIPNKVLSDLNMEIKEALKGIN